MAITTIGSPATLDRSLPADRKFRPDVEGLRAVAVTLVVLYHAGVPGLEGGYVGVDVFFVLSGFLITGLLIAERDREGRTSMLKFYARRARRILPAATLVLIVAVVASYVWLGFLRGNGVADDGIWTAIFAANVHLAESGTQYLNAQTAPSPLQSYWSLAVEEQFYLVWPLLIAVIAIVGQRFSLRARIGLAAGVIIAGSLIWSIIETPTDGVWAYFSPLTRAWELAAGALMAVVLPRLRCLPTGPACVITWAGLVGIVTGALAFNSQTIYPGAAVILPVVSTLLVIAGGTVLPRCGAEIILGTKPFLWIGLLSYSLYLWHWPLLSIANERSVHSLALWQNLLLVGCAVVLSYLTFRFLENPVRTARSLVSRPVLSIAMGLVLVGIGLGVCLLELSIHPHVQQIQTDSIGPTIIHMAQSFGGF